MRRGTIITPSAPVEILEGGSATLSPGKEFWVTAPTKLTLARSARLGDRLVVVNNTEAEVAIAGQNLSGVDRSGVAFANQSAVRLAANGEARLVRSRRGWRVRGCDRAVLTFAYNGVPLSLNDSNPGRASGLFHWLGQEAAKGSGQPWVNPAGTASITAVISSLDVGSSGASSMTNRVASGENVISGNTAGSWMGWLFSGQVRATSFIFQTRSPGSNHPRNFQIRVGTAATLTASTDVSAFQVVQTFTNRSEVVASNTYYGPYTIGTPSLGNALIWQSSGVDSGGLNFHGAQEIEVFGDYSA